MCSYTNVLSVSYKGDISISDCGSCFRIKFGNLVLMQDYSGLLAFINNVQECYVEVKQDADHKLRDIFFATKISNMFLQFSANEICDLFHLMQDAVVQYELNL